jgi:very-short-patch-repair endonuclease
MRDVLVAAMVKRDGAITREEALTLVPRHVFDNAARSGVVVRVLPGVFVLADHLRDARALDAAVLAYVPGGALSHLTSLRLWDLPFRSLDTRRHVTVAPDRQFRSHDRLVIHRRRDFRCEMPYAIRLNGRFVTPPEQAVIESWPLLEQSDRRAPAIEAVSRGLTSGRALLAKLDEAYHPPGAAEMRRVFALLESGCRSELELWGHTSVFRHPSLPEATLQHRVLTEAGNFVLDRAYLEELVGVELDGAAWHGSREQRERDVRRDAALAREGWLIVRFTHERLHREPERCREELRQILAARRRQLGVASK